MLLKILNTNFSGISVESKDEGIVVSSVEEGRLAHVQGKQELQNEELSGRVTILGGILSPHMWSQ